MSKKKKKKITKEQQEIVNRYYREHQETCKGWHGVRIVEPPKRYGHPKFYELLDEIADLHSRKNYNYARDGEPLSNFYACERFGLPAPWGCLTRMTDKDDRKMQVLLKQDMVGEDITQTSRDDSIYNLIFEILWKEFMKNRNAKKIIELFGEIKRLLQEGKK